MFSNSFGPKDYEKRSKLSYAKSHGGGNGKAARDWLLSRGSGAVLIPISLYLFHALVFDGAMSSYFSFVVWLESPFNRAMLVMFIAFASIHGVLCITEVIHDYIDSKRVSFSAGAALKGVLLLGSVLSIVIIMQV